jgi:hypothetical protein
MPLCVWAQPARQRQTRLIGAAAGLDRQREQAPRIVEKRSMRSTHRVGFANRQCVEASGCSTACAEHSKVSVPPTPSEEGTSP